MDSTTWNPAEQETAAERMRLEHPGAKLGWSDSGGMVEQQAAAMEWVEAGQQFSRWTGEPLGEAAGATQSAGQASRSDGFLNSRPERVRSQEQ